MVPGKACDIIIPVFNALDDLRACVDSVLADSGGNSRLVIIDDCSTDPAVTKYLKSLEARKIAGLEIKYNGQNLGFVKTANRGMRESSSDVVLLNSDTVVTRGWLLKMARCAYSDESIASVTPLTNNGTICSVPNFYEDNPLPEGMSVAGMGALVERVSRRSYPKIPTAVGFCMYIKRAALTRVGYFDEETFGRGYEEENDWCMRARELGYTHALDDATFIYHKGAMSFTEGNAELKEKNARILLERYPDYSEMVGRFVNENPLREIHERIKSEIERVRAGRQSAIWPAMKRAVPHPVKWFIKYKILGAPHAVETASGPPERILNPQTREELSSAPEEGPDEFGVNVAGYFRGEFGVAEAARSDVRDLESAGVPCALNDIAAPEHSSLEKVDREFSRENPYKYNLVHVNADVVLGFIREKGPGYFGGRYNIGYWVWELPVFPEKYIASFSLFNEIWTPSAFCVDSISRVSRIPVLRMPHSIDIDPQQARPARGRFGLKEEDFVFLVMFDFRSIYERKNPTASIRSFRKAFRRDDKVRLVVKHINSEAHPTELETFNKELDGLDVTVIGSHLRKEEVRCLIASCDCYVSLHRSEGFGLTIAEAMALGKPVIATAYSGNTDYMDINNSLPVKYSLVELDRDYPPYEKGNMWADPDTDHAAELMRKVYEDRGHGESIGARAARSIRERLSPAAVGRLYRGRLEHLDRCN